MMRIEIWSDVVCPWCYIGKRRLDAALARFEHADRVEVVWRSFELDPSSPRSVEGDYATRLGRKYGVPASQAQGMIDRITRAGVEVGVGFRFDIARPGNTFDAHRLIHLAGERGVQREVAERLFAAMFTDGQPIGDLDTLARLGAEAGLDGGEVRTVLEGDSYAAEVQADERQARAFGITGVPFFVIDRSYALSGAQLPELLLEVLEKAWREGDGNGPAPVPPTTASESEAARPA